MLFARLVSQQTKLMTYTKTRILCASFSMVILSRLIVSQAKQVAMVGWGEHDDGLFLELAASILSGDWLGKYSSLTLIKGPSYPLFIAANYSLGVPLPLGEELFLLTSYLVFSLSAAKIMRVWWMPVPLFLVLAFLPISTATEADRVLRDTFYVALTFFVFASLFYIVEANRKRRTFLWPLLGGIALALFYTTREEAVWILPSAIFLLALPVYKFFKKEKAILQTVRLLSFMGLLAISLIISVGALNYIYYGIFVISDFRDGAFVRAYGAIQQVHQERPILFIPVPAETRRLVYSVSPTFAKLKDQLENPDFWRGPTCERYPDLCGEIGGGWFFWAIRHAAQNLGIYRSASDAAAFWNAVAEEITLACHEETISCADTSAGLALPFARWDWREIVKMVWKSVRFYLSDPIHQSQMASFGVPDRREFVEQLVGERVAGFQSDETQVRIIGWIAAPGDARLDFALEPLVRPAFPNTKRVLRVSEQRQSPVSDHPLREFVLIDACTASCTLKVSLNGTLAFSRHVSDKLEMVRSNLDSETILSISLFDQGLTGDNFFKNDRKVKIEVLSLIAEWYLALRLPAIIISSLAFFALLATRSLSVSAFFAIGALTIAASTRIALLGFLSGTSFPAIATHYMLPAYPLTAASTMIVLVLAVTRTIALFTTTRQRNHGKNSSLLS